MIDSTTRQRARFGKVLGFGGMSLLLLATGCKSSSVVDRNPSISVSETRAKTGVLEGVKLTGKGFAPGGQVLVTSLLAASGSSGEPYVEETVNADAKGDLTYERKPLKCPQPADYGSGSWTTITARDMTSGISATAPFHPGSQPDCTG